MFSRSHTPALAEFTEWFWYCEDLSVLCCRGWGTTFRGRGILITLVLREFPAKPGFRIRAPDHREVI